MTDGKGALCVGKWELFDATDSVAHDQAKKLCIACPALDWCRDRSDMLNRVYKIHSVRPLTGTWAARLYGAALNDPARFATEEEMFTDEDARAAHVQWNAGVRNDRTRIGERVYQRHAGRRKRERRLAAEQDVA